MVSGTCTELLHERDRTCCAASICFHIRKRCDLIEPRQCTTRHGVRLGSACAVKSAFFRLASFPSFFSCYNLAVGRGRHPLSFLPRRVLSNATFIRKVLIMKQSLLVAALLAVALSACGKKEEAAPAPAPAPEAAAPAAAPAPAAPAADAAAPAAPAAPAADAAAPAAPAAAPAEEKKQ